MGALQAVRYEPRTETGLDFDAIVIGAGVAGLYQLYKLRELIDSHPHKVRVECDQPRELAKLLVGGDHVVSVHFESGAVILETREPDKLYDAIPDAAKKLPTTISSLTSPDNNLASVFRYLTDEREVA